MSRIIPYMRKLTLNEFKERRDRYKEHYSKLWSKKELL